MCCAHAYNVLFGVILFKLGVVCVVYIMWKLELTFFRGCENERDFCGVSFAFARRNRKNTSVLQAIAAETLMLQSNTQRTPLTTIFVQP